MQNTRLTFFAKHPKDADGRFTEASLNDYLQLASVFATCEFNNLNVLKFLMSARQRWRDWYEWPEEG